MEKFEQIIFDNEYPKLQNAKQGILSAVITSIPANLLKTRWEAFLKFDTLRKDGQFRAIQDGIYYMLLLFIGDNGRLVPTLRKQNEENISKYADKVGSVFEFVIIEEK